jgi:metallo-beta-lactamase family protein
VPVRAEVSRIDALSAHADAAEMEAWLRSCPQPPRRVYLTHGEPAAADALRQRIERHLGWNVTVPDYLQTITLE